MVENSTAPMPGPVTRFLLLGSCTTRVYHFPYFSTSGFIEVLLLALFLSARELVWQSCLAVHRSAVAVRKG